MKTLKIGIAGCDRMRARAVENVSGEHEPARGEPTVRFISIEIFTKMLSQCNRELLAMIAQERPDSLTELADLAERSKPDLLRTLTMMSCYGLVELEEGQHGTQVPRVLYDRVSLDTQSVIEMLLRRIFERRGDSEIEIKKEWSVTKDSQDEYQGEGIYAPRIDIAIGPFNIGPDWNGGLCRINRKYRQYEFILGEIIQKGKLLSNEDVCPNQNPRCTVAIEIANHNEIKRMISDIFNASVIGKIGIFVYDQFVYGQDQRFEKASHRLLNYIKFLKTQRKGEMDNKILKNMIFIKSGDIVSVLERCLGDAP